MRIRLALLAVLATASFGASGQVFRTVDADGNVVFTDVPPPGDRTGQAPPTQVTVPPTNTVPARTAPATRTNNTPAPTIPGEYARLIVVSPTADQAIRDNAGNMRIEVAVTPPQLRPDHRLLLVLNGSPSDVAAVNGVFELSNVDRGTHTAGVRIVDVDGNVIIESAPTTFHLLRVAVAPTVPIAPPRPPPAN